MCYWPLAVSLICFHLYVCSMILTGVFEQLAGAGMKLTLYIGTWHTSSVKINEFYRVSYWVYVVM